MVPKTNHYVFIIKDRE